MSKSSNSWNAVAIGIVSVFLGLVAFAFTQSIFNLFFVPIVVAVLWEHGDWGSNAAKLASQVATVYVNKKRIQDQNALASIGKSSPVEMGAVWTEPATAGRKPHSAAGRAAQTAQLRGGHFPLTTAPLTPAKNVAGSLFPWPAWLLSSPLRFKEGQL